jgi:hypothetical protein
MIKICNQLYKGIYPIDNTKKSKICFLGDIRKFKRFFGYLTINESVKKYRIKHDNKVIKYFTLYNDPRFYEENEYTERRWNQLSLPFQIRATGAFFFMAGFRIFSLPLYNRIHKNLKLSELFGIDNSRLLIKYFDKNATILLVEEQNEMIK